RLAQQREARSLTLSSCQCRVTQAATSPSGHHQFRALAHQILDDVACAVFDDGATGHSKSQVFTCRSVSHVARALGAIGCLTVWRVVVVQQGSHLCVHVENYGTTSATVAAVGSAQGLELLTVDGGHAIATV